MNDLTITPEIVERFPFAVKASRIDQKAEARIGRNMAEVATSEGGKNLRFKESGPAKTELTTNQCRVLSALSDKPQRTVAITERVGLSNDCTAYTLSTLRRKGLAARHPVSNRANVYWVKA